MDTMKFDITTQQYPTRYTYRVPHSVGKSTSLVPGLLGMGGWAMGGDWSRFGTRGKRNEERARQALSRIAKRRNKRK